MKKTGSKTLFIGLAAIAISAMIVGISVSASGGELFGKQEASDEQSTNRFMTIDETLRKIYGDNATLGTPSKDELLGKYEKCDRWFIKKGIGNTIVYRHQRMIDNATVAGDYINYQFDKDTKELKKKIIHWRDDLPEHLPPVIPKEEAESLVRGEVQFTTLYFILPDTPVFPIEPAPEENPCWAVSYADDKGYNIDVII